MQPAIIRFSKDDLKDGIGIRTVVKNDSLFVRRVANGIVFAFCYTVVLFATQKMKASLSLLQRNVEDWVVCWFSESPFSGFLSAGSETLFYCLLFVSWD